MRKHILRFSLALVVAFICAGSISAQFGSYAIKGAKIVTVSGAEIESGNVVIRDGLIESVGASAKIPADAKIIDGSGLVVYPGFIDSKTNIGITSGNAPQGRTPMPAPGQTPQSNSNYPNALRPERYVADDISEKDSALESHRNAGFTTALTVNPDGIFNGYSAVIGLGGDSVSKMVIKPRFAEHVVYRTAGFGGFPSSLMGTFAALRQMFLDAKRLDDLNKLYAKDPRGLARPESDPSLEALIPVVRGEIPIVIEANSEREIQRSLDLAKEFGLKLIVSGGQESGKLASRLKAQNVPVLLSANFPKRTTAESEEADPESMEILRLRAEVPKNAGKLKSAGVKYAFQSDGAKDIKEVFANVADATNFGITKADAVRAFTLDAANILGIDTVAGSLDPGKIANLTVVKGDVFSKDAEVKQVFIDGKLYEMPAKPAAPKMPMGSGTAAPKAVEAPDFSGIWKIAVETPGEVINLTLSLKQSGNTITGTLGSPSGTVEINNGKASDRGFSFDAVVNYGGENIKVAIDATVSGEKVEGTATTDFGTAPFSGSRQPAQGRNE